MISTPAPFNQITNAATVILTAVGDFIYAVGITAVVVAGLVFLVRTPGDRDAWLFAYLIGLALALVVAVASGDWVRGAIAIAVMPVYLGVRWIYRRYAARSSW